MLGHENSAAVLVWLNGCLKCSNFLRNIYNILLIKANHRTENRKSADLVGHCQRVDGLGSHLSDALACNQAQALVLLGQILCNLHHVAAHDNGQLLVRTLIVNIELDVCKVDYMKLNGAGVAGYLLGQVDDLLLRSLAGVRRSVEIHSLNDNASLGNHVSCYRAVDSAGEKEHGLSVGSHRHSARAWNHQGVNIDLASDLHV